MLDTSPTLLGTYSPNFSTDSLFRKSLVALYYLTFDSRIPNYFFSVDTREVTCIADDREIKHNNTFCMIITELMEAYIFV
jgi:hypothetical protein